MPCRPAFPVLQALLASVATAAGGELEPPRRLLAGERPVDALLGHAAPHLADWDGDGDLDLLVGESSGEVNAYRNDGGTDAPSFVLVSDTWGGLDAGRRSAPALADVDGDGRLEAYVGGEEGALLAVSMNGFEVVRSADVGLDLPANSAPRIGDLDGDGVPELVVGNRSGGLLYFRRSARP